ncbi:MAG: hypothetical protein NC084_09665 [Bacteroides sp.]|nr:hypothetical protein [Eubacterium sp.]MCM1419626.1 hypothetical protein [Roseburia sp.]MCM1462964.1 hypothetical protein [Bacteroides sp.]
MNVQFTRTKKLEDTVELIREDGAVERLTVSLDLDTVARGFLQKYNVLVSAHRTLRELQKRKKKAEFEQSAALYGAIVIDLLELTFGKENAAKILEFYENGYFEMVQQIMPYITGRVLPAIREALKQQKNRLKRSFKQL